MSEVVLDEVAGVCEQLHALECATRAEPLRQVTQLQSTDEWKNDGASSLASWLSMRLGLSRSEAAELVRVADSVAFLPQLLKAFSVGRLSWKRLCLIVRLAEPDTDGWWAEHGPAMSLAQLQAWSRKAAEISDEKVREAISSRYIKWQKGPYSVDFYASMPLAEGEVVISALERIANQRGIDPETGLYPPFAQALADGLVELASMALGADADADRATVVVEVPYGALADLSVPAEIGGRAVANSVVRRLSCDARVQLATVDPASGQTIGIGRASRTIPPWLARRIRKRDQGCRFPGCGNQRWTHAHHIRFWSDDGPTDEDNLVTLCGTHHRFFHEQHWRIEGKPANTLTFVRPDGRRFDGSPPPLSTQAQLWVNAVHHSIRRSA